MAASGNSAIHSLLQKSYIRLPLKLVLGMIAFGVALLVIAASYNTIDEDLSPEATALLAPLPLAKIEDRNGYIAFLGMVAPPGQDQMDWGRKAAVAFTAQSQPGFTQTPEWKTATSSQITLSKTRSKWCSPTTRDCLAEAKVDGETLLKRLAEADNAELLARYRRVREAPEFSEIYMGPLFMFVPNAYSALNAGAALSLTDVAMKVAAGDLDAVVAELEREVAFHRRVIAGGQLILTARIGETLLARDLLTISELQRSLGERLAPYHARLRELTRPQITAALAKPMFLAEARGKVHWARQWRRMLRDNSDLTNTDHGMLPMENLIQSLFIRPNETANRVASFMTAEVSITDVAAVEFDQKAAAILAANTSLLERPWYAELRNPVGKGMVELSTVRLAEYAASMNDLQALERMVDLQLAIAASGGNDPAAFILGEGAKLHADPYTGKPFAFDPEKRLLSFEPRAKGGWRGDLKKRHARTAIAL